MPRGAARYIEIKSISKYGLCVIVYQFQSEVYFSILQMTEHHSQANVPTLKPKPYKVTKYKIFCSKCTSNGTG